MTDDHAHTEPGQMPLQTALSPMNAAPQSDTFVQIVDRDSSRYIRRDAVQIVEPRRASETQWTLWVLVAGMQLHLVFSDEASRARAIALLINPLIP